MEERLDQHSFFQRRAPAEKGGYRYPMYRAPARRRVCGTCLSADLITGPVHYVGKRSTPCIGADKGCLLCPTNVARWKLWIIAMEIDNHQRAIVEMTDKVQAVWEEAFCTYRSLKGLTFQLWRKGSEKTGELYCRIGKRRFKPEDAPRIPSLQDMLFTMWEVPPLLQMDHPISLTPLEARQRKVGEL